MTETYELLPLRRSTEWGTNVPHGPKNFERFMEMTTLGDVECGPPKATDTYTTEQLEEMGYLGAYVIHWRRERYPHAAD